MGAARILVISGGAVAMMLLMLLRRNTYPSVAVWKYPVISLLLTIAGVSGTMVLFFIETGRFGGTSFFGAVLFVPVLILPALLLRLPYRTLMDLCAPAECLMLAIMKVDCLLHDCCIGKYLPALEFQFPSQIVEMAVALLVMLALIRISEKPGTHGTIYGWYLILYGATRFCLNWFRYGITPFVWVLPAGNFWSLVAIGLGIVWVSIARRAKK